MFNDVGNKIKGVASVFCWLGIISSCLVGIMLIYNGIQLNNSYYSRGSGTVFIVAGLVLMIVGSIVSWIGSIMVYGFGALIDNSKVIREDIRKMKEKQPSTQSQSAYTPAAAAFSQDRANLQNAANYYSETKYETDNEAEEIYKTLSECPDAKSMRDCIKAGFSSNRKVLDIVNKYASEEEKRGGNNKMVALGEVKKVLGL